MMNIKVNGDKVSAADQKIFSNTNETLVAKDIPPHAIAVGNPAQVIKYRLKFLEVHYSPAALQKATHFITTREMSTLEALDYLWNTDVKIISGLDNGIFSWQNKEGKFK